MALESRLAVTAVVSIAATLLLAAPAAWAQAPDTAKVEYRSEKLTDNLYALFGAGGNIAVLTGPDGALVIDSDLLEMSAKLRAALALVSDKPARFLINTHFHLDHTGETRPWGELGPSSSPRTTCASGS
jgi:glyoxylase-like metal-dependent hydrolase (beta-lactamase superfamily II)